MPINHDEIIEEVERHIRKFGGERSEWCVGTAERSCQPSALSTQPEPLLKADR
jgi:hypothetical protein